MLIGIDASRAFVKDKTGTENYSYELIKAILELPEARKHTFRLYVRKSEGSELALWDRPASAGLEVRNPKTLQVIRIPWKFFWTQGGLAWELLRRPVDVLWVPAHTLPIVRSGKMETVVTIHGLEYEYLPEYNKFPQSLYLNKSTEYAVKHADKLIAVSNWTKSQLVDRLGADGKKIKVIYEGVGKRFLRATNNEGSELELLKVRNHKYERQIRHKYGLHKNYILFLGTIQPRKNLVRLIEAYSMVVKESVEASISNKVTPSGFAVPTWPSAGSPAKESPLSNFPDLIIAGKKGWMAEEIYKAPKKYGVEDKVKFVGRVAEADIVAVYKMARLFVWPSLMEGFGLPILEAMQLGVPVITSNRGALIEVGGKASLQVNPEKVEEIAEAIKLVLNTKELREGLVERGYKQVKKFSWDKASRETLKILTSI